LRLTTGSTDGGRFAARHRGAIPADCWHDPYLNDQQLGHDISAEVTVRGEATVTLCCSILRA